MDGGRRPGETGCLLTTNDAHDCPASPSHPVCIGVPSLTPSERSDREGPEMPSANLLSPYPPLTYPTQGLVLGDGLHSAMH